METTTRSTKTITDEIETLSSVLQALDQDDDARVARIIQIKSNAEDFVVQESLGQNVSKEMKLLRNELADLESVPDKRAAHRRAIQKRTVELARSKKVAAKAQLADLGEKNLERVKGVETAFIDAGRKLLGELDLLTSIYSLSGKANDNFPGRTPRKVLADTINVVFFPELRGYLIQKPRDERPISGYLRRFK